MSLNELLLVQEEVRATLNKTRTSRMSCMKEQGAWLRWGGLNECRLTCTDIWWVKPQRITLLIQPVHDMLPSPSPTPSCPLCSWKGMLKHISSRCLKALGDGHWVVPWVGPEGIGWDHWLFNNSRRVSLHFYYYRRVGKNHKIEYAQA